MGRACAAVIAAGAMALGGCETLEGGPFAATPLRGAAAPEVTAPAPPPPASASALAEESLLEAERTLARAVRATGLGPALADAMDPIDGYVVRAGRLLQGRDAIIDGLRPQANAGELFWQPDRALVSQSGDLGVTSGRFVQVLRGAEAQQGRYVITWRKDFGGTWRPVSEVAVADPPLPPPPRAAATDLRGGPPAQPPSRRRGARN